MRLMITKHKKILFACSAVLMLSQLLTGCSSHASVSSSTPKNVSEPIATELPSSSYAEDNSALTYDDAKELCASWLSKRSESNKSYSKYGAYYVKKSDGTFYSLLPAMKTSQTSRVLLLTDVQESNIPTISRNSNDSLIFFSTSDNLDYLMLGSVAENGYTIPISLSKYGFTAPYAYNNTKNDFVNTAFDSNTLDILYDSAISDGSSRLSNATLNGLQYDDISNLQNIVHDSSEKRGADMVATPSYIVSMNHNESAHIEYHIGTDYGEADINADYLYLVLNADWSEFMGNGDFIPQMTKVPISLSNEGYAEADISSLTPGFYAIPVSGYYSDYSNDVNNFSATLSPYVVFKVVY